MAETDIKHAFVNPQPDDVGPDTYTKPKHWNAKLLVSGGSDLEMIVRDSGSSTGASYRALVAGTGITITPSASSFTIALSGSLLSGSGTTNRATRWVGPTTLGDSAFRDDGTIVALGGALSNRFLFHIPASFTGTVGGVSSALFAVSGTISGPANNDVFAAYISSIVVPVGTPNLTASLRVDQPTGSQAGAATSATVHILGAPTGAGSNYALLVQAGSVQFSDPGTHSIGTTPNANAQLIIGGSFSSSGAQVRALLINSALSPAVNADAHTMNLGGTINEAASGTHDTFTSLFITPPNIVGAGAALTNAASLRIQNEPTGAANNYALWVAGGRVYVASAATHGIGNTGLAASTLRLGGSLSGSGTAQASRGIYMDTTLTADTNQSAFGIQYQGTLNKAGSGTHADFAGVGVDAPTIGAGAATLTNATTLKIVGAPSVGDRLRSIWVTGGLSEFGGIVSVTGAGGTVNNTQVGIELRGSSTPSLLAFNRSTSAYLNMVYDALTHDFQRQSASMFRIGINDAQISQAGSWTGSVQTEGHRMGTTLNAVASANAFGLIFVPTFVEAASGTHGQLTGIYVAPTFTNGAGATTSVMGINIDMGAIGAIASTNAFGIRIAGPTGASVLNHALYVDSGTVRIDEYGHVIGGATNTGVGLLMTGTFPSGQTFARIMQLDPTVTANADGGNLVGIYLNPVFTERSGGTHAIIAGMYIAPTVTAGTANVTEGAGIYIDTTAYQTTTTDAAALILVAPTGGTNNYGLLVKTGSVRFSGVGPHAIGTALDGTQQIKIGGSFSPGTNAEVMRISTSVTPGASSSAFGITLTPTFVEGTGGAHTDFTTLYVEPTVTAGTSTLTNLFGIKVASLVAQTGTTNAILIDVRTLPTGATNNFVFAFPTDATDPTGGGGAATGRIPCLINGVLRYLAYY